MQKTGLQSYSLLIAILSIYLIHLIFQPFPTYEPMKHIFGDQHFVIPLFSGHLHRSKTLPHLGNVASALARGTAGTSLWEFLGIHPHDGFPKRRGSPEFDQTLPRIEHAYDPIVLKANDPNNIGSTCRFISESQTDATKLGWGAPLLAQRYIFHQPSEPFHHLP